jgi:nucleotide-binding universal stress UspA family protein
MKDQIIKISAAQNADYLVMGYYGRKGKKVDKTMMGSSLKATAYNIKAPLFIVRNI